MLVFQHFLTKSLVRGLLHICPGENYEATNFKDQPFQYARKKDGSLWYTGHATQETVMYEVKNEKVRSLEITEPLNLNSAKCFNFAGQSFPLRTQHDLNAGFKMLTTKVLTDASAEAYQASKAKSSNDRYAVKRIGAVDESYSAYSSDHTIGASNYAY